jgi:protocatechuate 3,4-dioxygenase beta subunit
MKPKNLARCLESHDRMRPEETRKDTVMNDDQRFPSRRHILTSGAFAATGLVLAKGAFAQPGLAPTPSCHDGDEATMPEIEGPFFKPKSPRRSDLREPGIAGRPVELSGVVLTRACRPVAGALVDLWQADAAGAYDNRGFRLRGHVFTDAGGR